MRIRRVKVLFEFLGHIVSAIFVFAIVGTGAVALHLLRIELAARGLDGVVEVGLQGLELLLFACDVTATSTWAIMSTVRAIREIWQEEHDE